MTGNELLVLVPWLLFMGCLAGVVAALWHHRQAAGRELPPPPGPGPGWTGRFGPEDGEDPPPVPPAGAGGPGSR